MLDFSEIALFVEVVKAGSFAEASRRLRIPSNSISRRISQLEESLGAPLLRRSTRHLSLTEAGSHLFEESSSAVSQLLQASQSIIDKEGPPRGLVRVAAPANFFDFFPIEWFAQFLEVNPGIRVEFVLDDLSVDLIQRGIDLALRVIDEPWQDRATSLMRVPAYWHLVASPAYLKRKGIPRTLQALTEHDCLRYTEDRTATVWRLSGPAGEETVAVSGRFGSNIMGVLLSASRAGIGIALMPAVLTASDLRGGRLTNVLPEYKRYGGGFYAVVPGRGRPRKAVSVLVEFLNKKADSAW